MIGCHQFDIDFPNHHFLQNKQEFDIEVALLWKSYSRNETIFFILYFDIFIKNIVELKLVEMMLLWYLLYFVKNDMICVEVVSHDIFFQPINSNWRYWYLFYQPINSNWCYWYFFYQPINSIWCYWYYWTMSNYHLNISQ